MIPVRDKDHIQQRGMGEEKATSKRDVGPQQLSNSSRVPHAEWKECPRLWRGVGWVCTSYPRWEKHPISKNVKDFHLHL